MTRTIFIIIAATLAVILLQDPIATLFSKVWGLYDYITYQLSGIFSGGEIGTLIQKTIAIMSLTLLLTLVPIYVYSSLAKQRVNSAPQVVLCTWFILITLVVLNP